MNKKPVHVRAGRRFCMKKTIPLLVAAICLFVGACRTQPTYDRNDPNQDYERFLNSHVFAACENVGQFSARYSLADLLQRPQNDSAYYKVRFINGPCKGVKAQTTSVILKTQPIENASLIETGTLVLRNYDNPKDPQDATVTSHWNVGVVLDTSRAKKGILDVGFPRDRNDFFPARESVYVHNLRLITQPTVKDVRHFIH